MKKSIFLTLLLAAPVAASENFEAALGEISARSGPCADALTRELAGKSFRLTIASGAGQNGATLDQTFHFAKCAPHALDSDGPEDAAARLTYVSADSDLALRLERTTGEPYAWVYLYQWDGNWIDLGRVSITDVLKKPVAMGAATFSDQPENQPVRKIYAGKAEISPR